MRSSSRARWTSPRHRNGATRLRIDLAEVGFIDSAGLGVLIGVLKRIREVGGEIELVHVQPAPRKVIEITGLDELFSLSG